MSNLVIPNQAKINWTQAQIDNVPTLTDCYLRLFKSPISIDSEITLAELEAIQSDYAGYAPILLENWTAPVIIESAAMTEPDTVTYEATADDGLNIYGCYATNGAGDRLWFASAFTSPVPTPFNAELQVSIELDLTSIFPS